MKNVTLYGFQGSTYLRTVQMVCEHKSLPYEIKPLEFKQPSHRRLHPFLKMPVMELAGVRLFESLAICTYLEDLYPEVKLIPDDPEVKARALQWISAFIDYLAPVLIKGKPENPGDKWPESLDHYLEILNDNLEHTPFIAGHIPTLADLYFAPAIEYALGGPGFDDKLSKHEHLMAWWAKASACTIFEKTQAA